MGGQLSSAALVGQGRCTDALLNQYSAFSLPDLASADACLSACAFAQLNLTATVPGLSHLAGVEFEDKGLGGTDCLCLLAGRPSTSVRAQLSKIAKDSAGAYDVLLSSAKKGDGLVLGATGAPAARSCYTATVADNSVVVALDLTYSGRAGRYVARATQQLRRVLGHFAPYVGSTTATGASMGSEVSLLTLDKTSSAYVVAPGSAESRDAAQLSALTTSLNAQAIRSRSTNFTALFGDVATDLAARASGGGRATLVLLSDGFQKNSSWKRQALAAYASMRSSLGSAAPKIVCWNARRLCRQNRAMRTMCGKNYYAQWSARYDAKTALMVASFLGADENTMEM